MVETRIPFRVSDKKVGDRGLEGHLRLVCASGSNGETVVREQSFSAPVHLSKPYEDAGMLVINLVNPTAGYFSGDRVTCQVNIEAGAKVVLTSPSASRVHCMHGGNARLDQQFRVSAGAWLEVFPELFIPQSGARHVQRTSIEVEQGGEVLLFETLAPGRVASGEVFAFHEIEWETRVFYAGRLVVQEHYILTPEDESLHGLRVRFPAAYYASCFAISPSLDDSDSCWQTIGAWTNEVVIAGSTRLTSGGYVVKLLAADSLTVRQRVTEMRRLLYHAAGREMPVLRRV